MGNRIKPRITGGVGTAVSTIWVAYSWYSTAAQLPADAEGFARMLADPPLYLPWIFLVGFACLLGWSLWPRPDEDGPENGASQTTNQTTSGPHSPALAGVFHGPITFNPPPAATEERKSPHGMATIPPPAARCPETRIWQAIEHVKASLGGSDQAAEALRQLRQASIDGRIEI